MKYLLSMSVVEDMSREPVAAFFYHEGKPLEAGIESESLPLLLQQKKKEFLLMKYVSPGTTQSIKINQPKTQPVDQEESSTLPDLCVSSTERVRQVSLMPVFLGSLIGQCLFPYLSKSEELSI